jgi:hypothetical protein
MISPPWLNTRFTGALDAVTDSTRNAKENSLLKRDRFADQKLGTLDSSNSSHKLCRLCWNTCWFKNIGVGEMNVRYSPISLKEVQTRVGAVKPQVMKGQVPGKSKVSKTPTRVGLESPTLVVSNMSSIISLIHLTMAFPICSTTLRKSSFFFVCNQVLCHTIVGG